MRLLPVMPTAEVIYPDIFDNGYEISLTEFLLFINSGFIVASDPILASHPSGGLREVISEYQLPP